MPPMPPVPSIPSEDTDVEQPAFKILNTDNLQPQAGVVKGEAIFKPFGKESQKHKPNIMVYPTRRTNGNLEEVKTKKFSNSNGYIATQNKLIVESKKYSVSHGNLSKRNSASKKVSEVHQEPPPLILPQDDFTKTLDAKLRNLQREEKLKNAIKKSILEMPRKPFVTTVKKGEFLEPPPEYASLLGIRHDNKEDETNKLYAYASRPRIVHHGRISTASSNCEVHRSKCEAAAIAAAVIASGVAALKDNQGSRTKRDINSNNIRKSSESIAPSQYANLMFDRRVVRGSNYAQHPMPTPRWNPYFTNAKTLTQGDGESQAARLAEARRRALARKRAQGQQTKAMRLRLMSPPPIFGRKHEKIQTEKYLEELWEKPTEADNCTQTDLMYDRPMSPMYIPIKTGVDTATQIYPGDLFDFDVEVQPILEVLVGKTVEQALVEVLEEEELVALREQQRKYIEIRASELAETQRLEEQERRLRSEKDRRVYEFQEGCKIQQETEERIAASVLTQGYIKELLPSVLEGLNDSGFLYDNIKQDVDENFMPWLMKEVSTEMETMCTSRDVLTEIVKEILETRAELYRVMNEAEEGQMSDVEHEDQDIALAQHNELIKSALLIEEAKAANQ